ncbi:MAG TPA: helix-turn-helix transcriptional regulator [Clostridiales bacterium]|nr:helix-turn-helix transcriptional regulator [Clostridiales bacterium]
MSFFQEIQNNEYNKEYLSTTYKELTNDKYTWGIHSENRQGQLLYHVLDTELQIGIQEYRHSEYMKAYIISSSPEYHIMLKDSEIPFHYNDYIQITYILQGSLMIELDHQFYTFNENELYMIHPTSYHREVMSQSNAVVINICINNKLFDEVLLSSVPENSLQGFLRHCLQQEHTLQKFLKFTPSADTNENATVCQYISDILMECKSKKVGNLYMIKGYLVRLLDYMVNSYSYTFNKDTHKKFDAYLFQEVDSYMKANFADIQMKDLTTQFHYQSNYFNKLIHRFTGMSYSDYLIAIRVNIAKSLLTKSNVSIDDIMESVGYHNKGFFYKVFRNNVGMTPADYRKKYQK